MDNNNILDILLILSPDNWWDVPDDFFIFNSLGNFLETISVYTPDPNFYIYKFFVLETNIPPLEVFLESAGKKINVFFSENNTATVNKKNSVISDWTPAKVKKNVDQYIIPDPHYGHSPLDHEHYKKVRDDSYKPAKGFRYKMRIENLIDNIIVGYIYKPALTNPDLISQLPVYEERCFFRGVPYDRVRVTRDFERTFYAYEPLGYKEAWRHPERDNNPDFYYGKNRDIVRLYGVDSDYYKLKIIWLETEIHLIEQKLIQYCPRVVQNHLVFPDRAHPYWILVVKYACKLAFKDGIFVDSAALTDWKNNEEYFKFFCENIFYPYMIPAMREAEKTLDPGVRLMDHVPIGFKCW